MRQGKSPKKGQSSKAARRKSDDDVVSDSSMPPSGTSAAAMQYKEYVEWAYHRSEYTYCTPHNRYSTVTVQQYSVYIYPPHTAHKNI